jgi:hypothetical protein
METKNNLKKQYLAFNKKEKLVFLRSGLIESDAKKLFKIEKNSFYQRIILKHITKDKTFLKKILIEESYHNEIRLKALQNIKEKPEFYRDIFNKKIITINKKNFKVPYYSKIYNFCKYKFLSISKTIRFIKDI